MLITYFETGKMIVEDEQQDKGRAGYARETLINPNCPINYLARKIGLKIALFIT